MRKVVLLFLSLLMLAQVSAIGVAPAKTSFNEYSSVNLVKQVSLTIVNTGNSGSSVVLAAQGELGDYVSFSEKSFTFQPGQKEKTISYTVSLPEGLTPGPHTAEIIVLELPAEGTIQQTYVGAAVAVLSEFQVLVPYPGRYAEGRLVIDRLEDQSMNFVVPLISQGSFDLTNVYATIEVYNSLGQPVTTVRTEAVSIPARQRRDLVVNWVPTVPNGEYRAVATVNYGGDSPFVAEEGFSIGDERLSLSDVVVRDFTLGDVAKIEMVIASQWSEPIENVNIEMLIYDGRGNLVETVRTSSETIGAGEKVTMLGYWETLGVPAGDYDAQLFIRSSDSTTETNRNLVFELSEKAFTVVGFGYVISSGGDTSRAVYYLTGAIVVLILINLSWFIFLRKRFTDGGMQQNISYAQGIDGQSS